ncbi:MAG: hypothetical protein ABIR78_08020 [Ferruginibacter sp.]
MIVIFFTNALAVVVKVVKVVLVDEPALVVLQPQALVAWAVQAIPLFRPDEQGEQGGQDGQGGDDIPYDNAPCDTAFYTSSFEQKNSPLFQKRMR